MLCTTMGVRVSNFQTKNVSKVYFTTLIAFLVGGSVSHFQKKALRNTLIAPFISIHGDALLFDIYKNFRLCQSCFLLKTLLLFMKTEFSIALSLLWDRCSYE